MLFGPQLQSLDENRRLARTARGLRRLGLGEEARHCSGLSDFSGAEARKDTRQQVRGEAQ